MMTFLPIDSIIKEVYYAAYDGKELHFLTRESLNMKEKKRH